MSFCRTNEYVKEGDVAVIYLSFNQLYPIRVTIGLSHHTKYGSLKHLDLIGKKYGSKINCSKGTVYILQGSPELWTTCLPHRTQIIYTPNISVITLQLELKPGQIVVESGTGSASLSHALIRTIYPTGHLHTFEFHSARAETAKKEFKDHGLAEYVTVYNRDVCENGFGLENVADAVFLDLPSPWKALASGKKALKKEGGRLCSFSPCIEQVQKTIVELNNLGFTDIFTIEALRQVLCVKKYEMPDFDFDMDLKTKQEDQSNEIKAEKSDEVTTSKAPIKKKYKRSHNDSDNEDEDDDDDDDNSDLKKTKYSAKPINMQPGHTSYLTFATLLHKDY